MPEDGAMVYWIVRRAANAAVPHRDARLGPYESRERAETAMRGLGRAGPTRYAIVCDWS